MENLEQSSLQQSALTIQPVTLTPLQEISLFIQRMPAWLFAALSLIGIFFLYQGVGGLVIFLFFGMNVSETNVAGIRWATMLGQILLLLGPTVLFAKLRFPNVKNIFQFSGISMKEIVLVVVAVFTLQQLLQGYMMMQEAVPVNFPPIVQEFVDKMKEMMEEMYRVLTAAHSIPEFLFVVIVIAATPAVCEELLFRGLIQRVLEQPPANSDAMISRHPIQTMDGKPSTQPDSATSGVQNSATPPLHDSILPQPSRSNRGLTAAIIAGLIFAVYHVNPFTFIPLAVLGIFFGWIVFRTRNIVNAMVAHFLNNFLACLAIYLNLDDNFLAIAPADEPTTAMLATNFAVCAVVFVAATYYLVRATRRSAGNVAA